MKCYEVDFGYNIARIWIPDDADPIKCFYQMANQMFGIRKSITEKPVSEPHDEAPPPCVVPYEMALSHGGDLATFTAGGEKILNEWGDVYGVSQDELRAVATFTGRSDYAKLAEEMKAKDAALNSERGVGG